MFDFPILITLIISISIFYFSLYIPIKKELDDLASAGTDKNSKENRIKRNNRKKNLFLLNIITISLYCTIILLYFAPLIIKKLSGLKPLNLSDVINFILEYLPFKKGFFDNANFQFSYITGIILSIIVIIVFWIVTYKIEEPDDFSDICIIIIYSLLIAYGLIWLNYFASNILANSIIKYFQFFSIILNIILYLIVAIIIIILFILLMEFLT